MRVILLIAILFSVSLVPSAIGGAFDFVRAAGAEPTPTPQQSPGGKKNERPIAAPVAERALETEDGVRFRYVFSQPNFVYSRIAIDHDSSGRGKISFEKLSNAEPVVEEIVISKKVMDRIRTIFAALNFLDSDEGYQHKKDFSHLGNIEIAYREGDRSRTVEFNWTENIHARALMDDYRKLTQQSIWIFEMSLARDNQPLETPKIVESLEGLLRRNEIADPEQLISFLEELSADERLPLIARNRTANILRTIRKK